MMVVKRVHVLQLSQLQRLELLWVVSPDLTQLNVFQNGAIVERDQLIVVMDAKQALVRVLAVLQPLLLPVVEALEAV